MATTTPPTWVAGAERVGTDTEYPYRLPAPLEGFDPLAASARSRFPEAVTERLGEVETDPAVLPVLSSALAMADTRARAAVESLLPHALHSHNSPTTQVTQITDTRADLPASARLRNLRRGVPGDSSLPDRKRAGRVVHRVDSGGGRATGHSTSTRSRKPPSPGNHPVQGAVPGGPPRAPAPAPTRLTHGHSGTEASGAAPTHLTDVRPHLDTLAWADAL